MTQSKNENCNFLAGHRDDFVDITTARGLYYTFGLKLNKDNLPKNYRNYADRPNRYTVTQLKNQIKFVLNLDVYTKNESVDKYIYESFNVFNPDPVYVFVLPNGSSNRTLVFRRSNFSDISFPNTTSLQTIQTILKSSKYAHLFPTTDDISAKQQALSDKFFTNYKQFMSNENDLHEAESLKIVEENVRTEKNFFKFMDKLNDETTSDLSDSDESASTEDSGEQTPVETKYVPNNYHHEFIKEIHSKDHIGNYELAKDQDYSKVEWPANDKLSWDDFGLHGWVGNIQDQHENPHENG